MSVTVDLTEAQALTVLRAFLLSILPGGIEVVRGQINRVFEPTGPDFVVMSPILRERLGSNVDTYVDSYPGTPQSKSALQAVQFTAQVDVHGPASAENAHIITTLFRDGYAADQFTASGYALAPLFCSDPNQAPYMNGENQLEERWTVSLVMQMNPVVTLGQDFAGALAVNVQPVTFTSQAAIQANFFFTPLGATSFTFTSSSTGYPDSFAWDFRSVGATDNTAALAVYDYGAVGLYSATLTITKGLQTSSVTKTVYVGHLPSLLLEGGAGYLLAEDGSHILLEP